MRGNEKNPGDCGLECEALRAGVNIADNRSFYFSISLFLSIQPGQW